MIIAIDFDGTCVKHEYPEVGIELKNCSKTLKQLISSGHKLVLNTMRSGKELEEAVHWFAERNISLYGVNQTPGQKEWTSSPKVYADMYIDDMALGCPKVAGFVNWNLIKKQFVLGGIL